MPVHNADVAAIFNEIADLLELEEANPFRVRAYRSAARVIGDLDREIGDMLNAGEDPTELPGVGDDLTGKIREIVTTGHALPMNSRGNQEHDSIIWGLFLHFVANDAQISPRPP